MANAIRAALSVAALISLLGFSPDAAASVDPNVPITGATTLGAGFSGKPFVLAGDVVMETIGLYESIRDYEDAANPEWIAWYEHSLDSIWQRILHDDGLLVALRDPIRPGFEVLDVSDPADPRSLAAVDGNHFPSGWLHDGALVVAGEHYLIAYDLADPTAPEFAHFMLLDEHQGRRWFSAQGDVLYAVNQGATLRALDISDPLHPGDLGTIALPGERIDAMVAGDGVLYLLIAAAGGTPLHLVTYDVSDPLEPLEIGRQIQSTAPDARGLQLMRRGDLLLAGDDAAVRAYDVGDPLRPVSGYELPIVAEHLDVSDHQVFVMTGQDVSIFPRTPAAVPPNEPVVRSLLPRLQTIDGEGPVQIGQLHGDYHVLVPIDVSNPRHPRIGEPFDTGLSGAFIYADELGMMVNIAGSFQLVDLADPWSPQWLGGVSSERVYFFRARLTREVAVVETGSVVVELRFYDLSDPMAPRLFTKVYDYGLEDIEGDLMVCSRADRIRIYDVSDLEQPRLLRQQVIPGAVREVKLHQQHAFVLAEDLTGLKSIHAVRLTDPGHPELVASVPLTQNAGNLDAHDGRLYAYGYHVCQILDVAEPEHMAVVAEFPAFGHTGSGLAFHDDVTTVGGWLVTMRDDGLSVSAAPDRAPAAASRLEPAYPNPLNPSTTFAFSVDRSRELTLTVHDVRGRLVARLVSGRFEPGRHTVRWDGQDAAGQPVASGVYLVRLHGDGLEASGTVTVVK